MQKQKNIKLYLALVVILQCLDGFSMKQNVMGYLQVYSTIRNTKHILNYYKFLGPLLKMTRLLITGFCSSSELQIHFLSTLKDLIRLVTEGEKMSVGSSSNFQKPWGEKCESNVPVWLTLPELKSVFLVVQVRPLHILNTINKTYFFHK